MYKSKWGKRKEHGITVNAICPTAFPHVGEEEADAMSQHRSEWVESEKNMPQDIAEAVVYLVSEAGRFVTCNALQIRVVKRTM